MEPQMATRVKTETTNPRDQLKTKDSVTHTRPLPGPPARTRLKTEPAGQESGVENLPR